MSILIKETLITEMMHALNVCNVIMDRGTAVHSCNPITWETERRESQITSEPGSHSNILSQKQSSTGNFQLDLSIDSLNKTITS